MGTGQKLMSPILRKTPKWRKARTEVTVATEEVTFATFEIFGAVNVHRSTF